MSEKHVSGTGGRMIIPRQYLGPLFTYLGVSPGPLFDFFSLGTVSDAGDTDRAVAWWNAKHGEEQERYRAAIRAMANPDIITRLVSVQYFDQAYVLDLFSLERNNGDTVCSLSLSGDGDGVVCDDSRGRADYINAGIGFLQTGELARDLSNAALVTGRDSFLALAGIIDFLQNAKYSQALSRSEPSHAIPSGDLKRFLAGFEGTRDTRWLTSLVLSTFPYNPALCRELDWTQALASLKDLGFILSSPGAGTIELTESGLDFCCAIARSAKRLAITTVRNDDRGRIHLNNCLIVRTWNRVWAVSAGPSPGQVSLATLEPVTLFRLLDEVILPWQGTPGLSPGGTRVPAGEVPEVSGHIQEPGTCPSCGATLPAGARFCRKCGTPVQPAGNRR